MTRKVTFTSLSNGEGLPDISSGQNWVNDRSRRVQSEPRKIKGYPKDNANTFPLHTPSKNGHLVSNGLSNGVAGTRSHGGYQPPRGGRRLQSLPPTKPKTDQPDYHNRQTKSAPNNEGKNGLQGTPTHANKGNYRATSQSKPPTASDKDGGNDMYQVTHGKATRTYEEKYLRSNKFASSWAQVRADNPEFHHMPSDHSLTPTTKIHKSNHNSPDSGTRDSSPSNQDINFGKSPTKAFVKQNNIYRGRPRQKTRVGAKSHDVTDESNAFVYGHSPGRTESGNENNTDSESPDNEQRERKVPKKREWNNSVVVPPYQKPPPKHATLRYLDNLTFKPTINTGKEVFKTYVGSDKKGLVREKTSSDNLNSSMSENEEGFETPLYDSCSQDESCDNNSQKRKKKEPFLNRREARKYIKMTNVYGSDAYKNQRKEWFIQRLADVQEKKAQFEDDEKKMEKKKRAENAKRQHRQLNYVRSRFRKEQEQRFRTQYVTARVLEYEQENRHVYGLPEDFLDLANELNKATEDDENRPDVKDESESKENELTNEAQNKVTNQNSKKPPPGKSDVRNKSNVQANKQLKSKTNSPDKDASRRQKEDEALAKAQANQRNWYAKSNFQIETTLDDEHSHTSHASSGYESEHQLGNNDEVSPLPASHLLNEVQIKNSGNHKLRGRNQNNKTNQNNRLQSQKNIYAQENANKRRQTQKPVSKQLQSNNTTRFHEIDQDTNDINHSNKMHTKSSPNITSNKDNPNQTLSYQGVQGENDNDQNYNTNTKLGNSKKNSSDTPNKDIKSPKKTVNNSQETSSNSRAKKKLDRGNENENNTASSNNGILHSRNDGISFKNTIDNISNENTKDILPPNKIGVVNGKTHSTDSKHGLPISDSHKQQQQHQEQQHKQTQQPDQTQQKIRLRQHDHIPPQQQQQQQNQQPVTDASTHHKSLHPTNNVQSKSNKQQIDKLSNKNTEPSGQAHSPQEHNLSSDTTPSNTIHPDTKNHQQQTHVQQPTANQNQQKYVKALAPQRQQTTISSTPSNGFADDQNGSFEVKNRKPSRSDQQIQPKKKEKLADRMFNINTGPTWDKNRKAPKMEGIDTVVVNSKDKRGRDVKKIKNVKDVVKEAGNLLKVKQTDPVGVYSKRGSRAVSPDITLGSDFEVDLDEEPDEDIFERMRKKYNIAIDSDDEV